jgi:hypothetical protein
VPIERAGTSQRLRGLSDSSLRAWAVQQARALYDFEHTTGEDDDDFSLAFGKAECAFALEDVEEVAVYTNVARKAMEALRSHREPRRTAELAQILLVCRGRLLAHSAKEDKRQVQNEVTAVTDAYGQVLATMRDIADQQHMTIFSQLQKRNVTQNEFEAEAQAFESQALQLAADGD